MTARAGPRVFSVVSGAPFLRTMADALLERQLFAFGDDPLDLAGVTILLPTRRAVRAFREELIQRLGADAAILPTIRPIGDVDEEDHLLESAEEDAADRLLLPQAIAPLSRRLALTRMILTWARALRSHPLALDPDEPLQVPGSAADAARLSGDLARLIDDMATANKGAAELAALAPDDHAEYFRLTLEFLRIVTETWPQHLAELGFVDPATRRDILIRAAAERLGKRHGGPIVAAGSTGSIPATAALLRAIAMQADGAVVLPGLDRDLDAAGWTAIGGEADGAAGESHPQAGMKRLIEAIGITREDVVPLGPDAAPAAARARLTSEAMRPASTLDAWMKFAPGPQALDGVSLVVARNEQEEAAAIALAVREALETPDATVAVVTPDRTLARRVAAELARWKLAVDDSAGAPLEHEPHGVFARLVLEAVTSGADPVTLLALLKHPFAAFGMDRAMCRRAARMMELALFRGRRTTGGIAGLADALAKSRARIDSGDRDVPSARRRLGQHDWDLADRLVSHVTECLAPMERAFGEAAEISVTAATDLLIAALRGAATDETGSDSELAEGPGGESLAGLLGGLAGDPASSSLTMPPDDFPYFLQAMMAGVSVTRPAGPETRVHIWGALEARLQSADLIILASLDEGVWPAATRTDPWLSRAMRAEIDLPPPERRTGLAAHDFVQGLASPRVMVTRAEKRGGAPTVESRWLQRIRALAGKKESDAVVARGARYIAWARALNHVAKDDVKPLARPRPTPPVAVRPQRLSITEIEKLIRDPYAIYAKHILRLDPLDPLGRDPDAALRGTLIHKTLGDFTAEWRGAYDDAAAARLDAIARDVLDAVRDYPDAWSVWSIRFAAIADWFMAWERDRAASVAERAAEVAGSLAFPIHDGAFTLRGRADRIDLMADGTVEIYDFKSGTPQTDRTVFAGLTPQMTLEAAMVRAGSFDTEIVALGGLPLAGRSIRRLSWLGVGNAGRNEVEKSAITRGQTADALADAAHQMFADLVAAFATPDHPYTSRTRPMTISQQRYAGDYDHLARVREWSLLESEAEAAG